MVDKRNTCRRALFQLQSWLTKLPSIKIKQQQAASNAIMNAGPHEKKIKIKLKI